MKKLTSEEKEKLQKALEQLDKIGGKDVSELKNELADAANLVADISNKPKEQKVKKQPRMNIEEMVEDNSERIPVIQRVLEQVSDRRFEEFGDEFEEEEYILSQDSYIDALKTAIEMNQQCADLTLVLLENAPDIYSKSIKKVLDANIENKRILKNVYKGVIDTL